MNSSQFADAVEMESIYTGLSPKLQDCDRRTEAGPGAGKQPARPRVKGPPRGRGYRLALLACVLLLLGAAGMWARSLAANDGLRFTRGGVTHEVWFRRRPRRVRELTGKAQRDHPIVSDPPPG